MLILLNLEAATRLHQQIKTPLTINLILYHFCWNHSYLLLWR